jgi:geranylgeranyl diphosphate synthase type II
VSAFIQKIDASEAAARRRPMEGRSVPDGPAKAASHRNNTSQPRTPPLVSEMLREYGETIRAELKRYLPERAPERYLYDLLADYPGRGGKMMRPTICIATARAFGASIDDALCSAVAIELIHNALLIHDDIQDGSVVRRGAPTMHLLHGIPLAINAGDALLLLSLRPLLDNAEGIGLALTDRIFRETERMAWESAEGQAMELGWRRDNCVDLSERDYLVMALKKTAWLGIIYPARIGALIGTRSDRDLERFVRFGFFLGVAFQIQDDLLNLVADLRYGKELDGDLFEGKRTLMLIHALREAQMAERHRLTELLARPREERRLEDVAWMRDLLQECGSIEYARRFAHGLAGAALHESALIYGDLPDSRDKAFMQSLATWVFERA